MSSRMRIHAEETHATMVESSMLGVPAIDEWEITHPLHSSSSVESITMDEDLSGDAEPPTSGSEQHEKHVNFELVKQALEDKVNRTELHRLNSAIAEMKATLSQKSDRDEMIQLSQDRGKTNRDAREALSQKMDHRIVYWFAAILVVAMCFSAASIIRWQRQVISQLEIRIASKMDHQLEMIVADKIDRLRSPLVEEVSHLKFVVSQLNLTVTHQAATLAGQVAELKETVNMNISTLLDDMERLAGQVSTPDHWRPVTELVRIFRDKAGRAQAAVQQTLNDFWPSPLLQTFE